MKTILRDSSEQFEILDKKDTIMELNDTDSAVNFLRRFLTDTAQMAALRQYVQGITSVNVFRMTDHEVITRIAQEVADGKIKFLKRASAVSARKSRLPDQAAQEGTIPPQQKAEEAKDTAWIEILLLDMNDQPVPNEKYKIELPDGSIVQGTLDAQGLARHTGLKPGECKVTFPDLDKEAWEPV
jgi:hypothetical protein